jgi:hypothetical protein
MTATTFKLVHSGNRRVQDIRLADALGLENPRRIRCWIALHKRRLEYAGELFFTRGTQDRGPKQYFLTSDQALLCVMGVNTPIATDLHTELINMWCDRERPTKLLKLWAELFGRVPA